MSSLRSSLSIQCGTQTPTSITIVPLKHLLATGQARSTWHSSNLPSLSRHPEQHPAAAAQTLRLGVVAYRYCHSDFSPLDRCPQVLRSAAIQDADNSALEQEQEWGHRYFQCWVLVSLSRCTDRCVVERHLRAAAATLPNLDWHHHHRSWSLANACFG